MLNELTNLKLHHIGYAVSDLDKSSLAFEALGASFFHSSLDNERNLSFKFAYINDLLIELVSPINPNQECAITAIIAKNNCSLYHICYSVENLDNEIKRLKTLGYRRVGRIIASQLYGYYARGCFLYNLDGGLIELIEL